MDAKQFSDGYPRTLTEQEIHRGDHSAKILPAQDWSYHFGTFLHAQLENGSNADFNNRSLNDYNKWVSNNLTDIETEITTLPLTQALHARNELNFHSLNRSMLGLWQPIIHQKWTSDRYRSEAIQVAQNYLALEGLYYFIYRQKMVDEIGSEAVHAPENKEFMGSLTGVVQEIDVAIILMDVLRKQPNLTVIPAPLQFERTQKRRNVDFVAVDFVDRKAIGIQVKTNVRQPDYDNADKKRVIFVDGNHDLDNVRAMRTRKGSSSQQVVPWPGIIAAKHIAGLKTQNMKGPSAFYRDYFMLYKFHARRLANDIKLDYQEKAAKIGERITANL